MLLYKQIMWDAKPWSSSFHTRSLSACQPARAKWKRLCFNCVRAWRRPTKISDMLENHLTSTRYILHSNQRIKILSEPDMSSNNIYAQLYSVKWDVYVYYFVRMSTVCTLVYFCICISKAPFIQRLHFGSVYSCLAAQNADRCYLLWSAGTDGNRKLD